MVPTRVLISKSSSPFTKILWWLLRAHRLQLGSPSLTCSIVFSVSEHDPCIYLFFALLQFYSMDIKVHYSAGSLFFVDYETDHQLSARGPSLVVWSRLGDLFVSQNPREFWALVLLNGFQVEHIPLICLVKFQFLAQFPADYLPYTVVLVL